MLKLMEFIFVRNVIFISDYDIYISIPNENVVMCSVGVDEEFNKKCHYVFDKSYNVF